MNPALNPPDALSTPLAIACLSQAEKISCTAVTVARPPLEAEQAGLNVNGQRMAQAERQFRAPLSGVIREENGICVREPSFGHEPHALDEELLVDSAVTCQLTPSRCSSLEPGRTA